jgi:hypothetical protein
LHDLIAVCKERSKIVNCLSIPLTSSEAPAPVGLASQEEAEKRNRALVDPEGQSWGVGTTTDGFHSEYIDANGQATFVSTMTGGKWWVFGVPEKKEDAGAPELYTKRFSDDLSNSTGLRIYAMFLTPTEQG